MRLKEKVAIVTGAAQGIGKAIAQRFSDEGAHVVMVDIEAVKGKEAASNINNAMFIECDVADRSAARAAVEDTVKAHGRVDIVACSAAILRPASVFDLNNEDLSAVLDVNVKGLFWIGQAAARFMVQEGIRGSIINLSSINSLVALPNQLAYNVSKGAVNQLTRAMSLSLAEHGIRVNAVAPGSINTEMLRSVIEADDSMRKMILSRTPLGRVGNVEEIAAVALFLASDDSSYVTGEIIVADGGRMTLNYTVPVKEAPEES